MFFLKNVTSSPPPPKLTNIIAHLLYNVLNEFNCQTKVLSFCHFHRISALFLTLSIYISFFDLYRIQFVSSIMGSSRICYTLSKTMFVYGITLTVFTFFKILFAKAVNILFSFDSCVVLFLNIQYT